ncbi:hypothetical protein QAD02_020497 [Eretmocerus hayati]|uniref:Uncharacterized protein n=1 Tax=Eretmocerus hayati TaxID=131215 RepID=A0ACC2PN29_9HYME|nr:hypothetical protein QAD02_020497 [Eretmocerus hayati]
MSANFGKCCKPLNDETNHSKSLRVIPKKIHDRFPHLDASADICDKCRKKVEAQTPLENGECAIIIQKMQNKFRDENTSPKKKELMMSFLPDSWSIRGKADFFNTSRRFVQKMVTSSEKSTVSLGTISNDRLPDETVELVRNFYLDDDNSRIMAGMKDTKSVEDSSNRKIHVQKRLVLYNLPELFIKFKDKHSMTKVGFSKFAQIRPSQCVLAGSSGTHSVCVCVHHQNVKLLLDGLGISKFTSGKLNNYRNRISIMVCENPTDDCFMNKRKECLSIDSLKKLLLQCFMKRVLTRFKINVGIPPTVVLFKLESCRRKIMSMNWQGFYRN